MIRSARHALDTRGSIAALPGERPQDDVRVLREIVAALCERVELLEAHALVARPLLVALAQRPG